MPAPQQAIAAASAATRRALHPPTKQTSPTRLLTVSAEPPPEPFGEPHYYLMGSITGNHRITALIWTTPGAGPENQSLDFLRSDNNGLTGDDVAADRKLSGSLEPNGGLKPASGPYREPVSIDVKGNLTYYKALGGRTMGLDGTPDGPWTWTIKYHLTT